MLVILISLVIAIFLEANITTLPLVLLIVLFSSVITRKNEMFAVAFFAGLVLDILSFGKIGLTSLYFTVFVLIIFMYQKKFEIETTQFILITSFLGSFGYLLMEGVRFALLQSLVASALTTISFVVYKSRNKKAPKYV